ncbi:putative lipoxygenase [Tirmania nivea]|nr:putative lipoxygenase [Tirmania nivea]
MKAFHGAKQFGFQFGVTESLLDGKIKLADDLEFLYRKPLKKGTLKGTTVAATEFYKRVIERSAAYYDIANYEPSIPQTYSVEQRCKLYQWKLPRSTQDFSPHLSEIPKEDQTATEQPLEAIFNSMRFLKTAVILGQIFPEQIEGWLNNAPGRNATIAEVEDQNVKLRASNVGIYTKPNIGERRDSVRKELDWFTDSVFAQQHLTGPNPATLTKASQLWIDRFVCAAEDAGNVAMVEVLKDAQKLEELYIQDYSDFRTSAGVAWNRDFEAQDPGRWGKRETRYGCAPVCLFRLYSSGEKLVGKLHPLSIVLDYRESPPTNKTPPRHIRNSVVTFNKRLNPLDSTVNQREDWPWRYAKTCVQSADWTRHEVAVHLVHTHFIEEAVIVAAHRSFGTDKKTGQEHHIYRLLKPHWLKTLSLNAAARSTLVPQVVVPLVGMTAEQLMKFAAKAYDNFKFTPVPEDLRARGFIPEQLDQLKYKNCAYARNINTLWGILHNFVSTYLDATMPHYRNPLTVGRDNDIQKWCWEMTNSKGGGLKHFPKKITTREQLVDILTMCIHIASPQHTAVNYLQEFYQVFVINKPPALYTPIPTSLKDWSEIREKAFTNALPIHLPRTWLLASHIPHLLNMTVASEQNLINYARSLYISHKPPGENDQVTAEDQAIMDAAKGLWLELVGFAKIVLKYNAELDPECTEYNVLKPDVTAVSILI